MTVFYPSCTVNLRVRFDEALQLVDVPPPVPQDGEVDAITGAQGPVLRPLITERGANVFTQIMNRVPRSASVELPGYRQAGTFSLEFDWRELPIDPRLMRAIGVEIYLGTVAPAEFSRGMAGTGPDGSRMSVLKTTLDGGSPNERLMVLAGTVDDWSVQHDDSASVVKLDGRDLRGTFLDSPVNPDVVGTIDLTQPIHQVVAEILQTHPAGQFMEVPTPLGDWPRGVVPSPADVDGLTRVRRGASGDKTSASGGGGGETTNYWDLITNYCFLVGAVPFFRGRRLFIRSAEAAFDGADPGLSRFDPAFDPAPRYDDSGNGFFVRKVIYGRDVQELTFERKYAGVKVPMIEVVSLDTSSPQRGAGKLLIAQWPPESSTGARTTGVSPSGEVAQTDKIRIPMRGVRSQAQLLRVAKALYEEIGRGELGGSVRTKVLASFKGDNADPDLLTLRPGDPVEITVDARALSSRAPLTSQLTADTRRSFDEQVAEIRRALSGKADGGDENLARVLVATARNAVLETSRQTYRVANVRFSWSRDGGVEVAFDFQNYVVARAAVATGDAVETSEEKHSSGRRRKKKRVDEAPLGRSGFDGRPRDFDTATPGIQGELRSRNTDPRYASVREALGLDVAVVGGRKQLVKKPGGD